MNSTQEVSKIENSTEKTGEVEAAKRRKRRAPVATPRGEGRKPDVEGNHPRRPPGSPACRDSGDCGCAAGRQAYAELRQVQIEFGLARLTSYDPLHIIFLFGNWNLLLLQKNYS